jgi:arsenate reductase
MKSKVLFVCIGNACRSQMAQAFARVYGKDVIEPESAGLTPAVMIPEVTHWVMRERGITLDEQFPKEVGMVPLSEMDLVVNLSGRPLPGVPAEKLREWRVRDPIGEKDAVHEQVRDEVDRLVMSLVLELRLNQSGAGQAPELPRNWQV